MTRPKLQGFGAVLLFGFVVWGWVLWALGVWASLLVCGVPIFIFLAAVDYRVESPKWTFQRSDFSRKFGCR
ncbi:MAG: hypothetical protein JKY94_01080 [Rhodobacteraceae bacterium]|nr:hypothetical protein [Paracoccaceae bacterium]